MTRRDYITQVTNSLPYEVGDLVRLHIDQSAIGRFPPRINGKLAMVLDIVMPEACMYEVELEEGHSRLRIHKNFLQSERVSAGPTREKERVA